MLQVAKVLKSNGTDGDILIGLRDIEIEELDTKEPVFIEFDGLPVPFFFESIQPKGSGRAIAHITGVDSLKDAEEIVGRGVFADYFEEEEEEENFSGWTLYDASPSCDKRVCKDSKSCTCRKIGVIEGIEDIPGNPCLVVGGQLIPLHEDFIRKIDKANRSITMTLPEGLV